MSTTALRYHVDGMDCTSCARKVEAAACAVAGVEAAGLVAWTGTRWPDLVVAAGVAALFLHSAWTIVGDARRELE